MFLFFLFSVIYFGQVCRFCLFLFDTGLFNLSKLEIPCKLSSLKKVTLYQSDKVYCDSGKEHIPLILVFSKDLFVVFLISDGCHRLYLNQNIKVNSNKREDGWITSPPNWQSYQETTVRIITLLPGEMNCPV